MSFKKGNAINLGRKRSAESRLKQSQTWKRKLQLERRKPSDWGAGFKKGSIPWNTKKNIAQKSYFAGYFDADGCVMIIRNNTIKGKTYYSVKVDFSSRYDKGIALEEGQKLWGGTLHKRDPRKHNHKEVMSWRLFTTDAEHFLKDILPYVKLKKEQVKIALEFRKLKTRKKGSKLVTSKEWEYRKKLVDKIRQFNS